jgi:hypothetical protein
MAAAPKRGPSSISLSLTEVDGRAQARPEAFGQVVVLRARDPRETPRAAATSSTELLAHDVDEAASAFALTMPNLGPPRFIRRVLTVSAHDCS